MKKFPIVLTALLLVTGSSPALAQKKKQRNKELKEWQQRKSDMQPLQLKELIEENHRLKTSNQKLTEEVKVTKEELKKLIKLKAKIDALRKQRDGAGQAGTAVGHADEGQVSSGGSTQEEGAWVGDDYEDLDALFSPQQQSNATGSGNKQSVNNYYRAQGMTGPDGFSKDDWAVDENGKYYIKGLIFKVQIGAYKQRDLSDVLEGCSPQEVFEQEQSKGINRYTLCHFRDYWKANKFKKELRAMGFKDAWIVVFKDSKRVPMKVVIQEVLKKKK